MKPDAHTRTEADAAAYANLAGRSEDFGDGPGDQSDDLLDVGDARLRADPWDLPATTPRPPFVATDEPPF